jgi:carbon-monoxide dehydrogenase medium subunit
VIPAAVDYRRATTIDDALDALADPEAVVLAGGQSLIPVLKLRLARPTVLVDVGTLPLGGVTLEDGIVRIGALTTWDELLREPALARPELGAIAACAWGIGDLQVRNRGTIGGSLVHADPASDFPAVALAFGASLRLRSPDGERMVEASDFFLGPFTTAIERQELLLEVLVPVPDGGSGSAYVSVEHPASGFPLAGAAALVRPDGSRSVGVTGVGGTAFVLPNADVALLGDAEVFGDEYASADYRRSLARVVVERALSAASARAEAGA